LLRGEVLLERALGDADAATADEAEVTDLRQQAVERPLADPEVLAHLGTREQTLAGLRGRRSRYGHTPATAAAPPAHPRRAGFMVAVAACSPTPVAVAIRAT
jgi:hypothetical protein